MNNTIDSFFTVGYEPELPLALPSGQHQQLAVAPVFVFDPELHQSMVAGRVKRRFAKRVERPLFRLLSGEMMLRYMGWKEAADLVVKGVEAAIADKTVTYDLHRLMEGAVKVKTSEFGAAIIENMGAAAAA